MIYIYHLNFFSSTVSTMQSKLENLNATNALTKEDLTICKKALFKAQEENHRLLNQLEIANQELSSKNKRTSVNSEVISSSTSDSHSSSPSTSADRSISKVFCVDSFTISFRLFSFWEELANFRYNIYYILVVQRLFGTRGGGKIIGNESRHKFDKRFHNYNFKTAAAK